MLGSLNLSFGLTLTSIKLSPELNQLDYHHTKFANDILKTVDASLLTNRQNAADIQETWKVLRDSTDFSRVYKNI